MKGLKYIKMRWEYLFANELFCNDSRPYLLSFYNNDLNSTVKDKKVGY